MPLLQGTSPAARCRSVAAAASGPFPATLYSRQHNAAAAQLICLFGMHDISGQAVLKSAFSSGLQTCRAV